MHRHARRLSDPAAGNALVKLGRKLVVPATQRDDGEVTRQVGEQLPATERAELAVDYSARWTRPVEALLLVCAGRTLRTAVPIAAVVGTVLSAVNQGTVITAGQATAATWIRVAVNYLVPFTVASLGWLSARHVRATAALGSAPVGPLGAGNDADRGHANDTLRPPAE